MFVLNGNAERILKTLKSCGLTEYESKVYFTLLLTGRSKMGELSKKSSVPQSKIYWVVEEMDKKGLVDVCESFPKSVSARRFEEYLSLRINEKQREISRLVGAASLMREIVNSLKSVAVKYKDKYRVFEPKHLRRRRLFVKNNPRKISNIQERMDF